MQLIKIKDCLDDSELFINPNQISAVVFKSGWAKVTMLNNVTYTTKFEKDKLLDMIRLYT